MTEEDDFELYEEDNFDTRDASISVLRHARHRRGRMHATSQEAVFPTLPSFYLPDDISPANLTDLVFLLPEDNNLSWSNYSSNGSSSTPSEYEAIEAMRKEMANIYIIIIPILVFFCALGIAVNLLILLSAFWVRRPLSPTLCFSISLAGADAYASLIMAMGLIVNSLLPIVYKIDLGNYATCYGLIVEAFRLGGVIVTVCHLLALAINHYLGIRKPLHYAATVTRRTAWIVITVSWLVPMLFFFVYFASMEGEGFRSLYCHVYDFLLRWKFRAVFSSLFFGPLISMMAIYLHIFIIVQRHQSNRERFQSNNHFRRNLKAAFTTLFILGTCIFGWMPAVLWNLLVCADCAYSFGDVSYRARVVISTTANILIILKSLVDPVIYAARMPDIQAALRRMRLGVCACGSQQGRDEMFGSQQDTLYTASVHGCHTRRAGTLVYRVMSNGSARHHNGTSLRCAASSSFQKRRSATTMVKPQHQPHQEEVPTTDNTTRM